MEGRWQLYNIWAAQHHQGMKDQLMALLQSHAQHVTNLKVRLVILQGKQTSMQCQYASINALTLNPDLQTL